MAQKNRANMLTDIVSNIYNNLINFITGQNAQDRFVNLLDSSPNILSDASQPNGYVSTDANNEMFSSYYDEEISRADLITDLTANLAVGGKFYRINDAVGSTITLLVIAESNINLYQFAIDATTGEIGTYDITTDVFSTVSGIPNIQQVLDVGNISTTSIKIDDGAGNYVQVKNTNIVMEDSSGNVLTVYPDSITIQNPSFGGGEIKATTLANNVLFELPNKAAGTETFAMLSDITGGVASVNSGTNISVDNTDPANPIINSLSDRYSTSSTSSNTIDNGNGKVFTVDANLAYIPLQEVLIVNDPTHHMHGTVVSYSGTTLTVDINSHTGTGTFSSWVINLDGTPVDAITGVGTANEIAYFTGGQVIDSLDTATYPSLTELSYVKNVTSAIQTQINGKQDTLVSTTNIKSINGNSILGSGNLTVTASGATLANCADGTPIIGVTTIQYSKGLLIPANSRGANDAPQIEITCLKTGSAGNLTIRMYWNTTNDLAGSPILLGTIGPSATLNVSMVRVLMIQVANGTGNATRTTIASASTLTGWIAGGSAASTLAIDWTANGYLIGTVQNASALDTSVCVMIKLN
jgi:hypothetical protein